MLSEVNHGIFSIFEDISDKRVLIAGGGHVAVHKLRKLIPFRQARGTLLSISEETKKAEIPTPAVIVTGACAALELSDKQFVGP